MYIDHIGFMTRDIERFESFWCDVVGFKMVKQSKASAQQMTALFGDRMGFESEIRRYHLEGAGIDLEIHVDPRRLTYSSIPFDALGMNHICLHLGGAGSRQKFLDALPSTVKIHTFDNPKGWQTIFVRDFEGNWVELREDFYA